MDEHFPPTHRLSGKCEIDRRLNIILNASKRLYVAHI